MHRILIAQLPSEIPPVDGLLAALAAGLALSIFGYLIARRYYVPTYNTLVGLEEDVRMARSNIVVLLQRRRDELNRLLVAVREATGHESTTLSEVIRAREAPDAEAPPAEGTDADDYVRRAIVPLNARTEEYPEITAIGNIQNLQQNIVKIEEELASKRQKYNDTVTDYNKVIRTFPTSVVAAVGGFERQAQFEQSDETLGVGIDLEAATEPGQPLGRSSGRELSLEEDEDGRIDSSDAPERTGDD